MSSTRYYQWVVVNNPGFLGAIEASVMKVAAGVLGEDPTTEHHAMRHHTAVQFLRGMGSTRERVLRLVAWLAVFHPPIATVVFDPVKNEVRPHLIEDAELDDLVLGNWTLVSSFEDPGPQ